MSQKQTVPYHFCSTINFKASLGNYSRLPRAKYILESRRTWNNIDPRTHQNKEIMSDSSAGVTENKAAQQHVLAFPEETSHTVKTNWTDHRKLAGGHQQPA